MLHMDMKSSHTTQPSAKLYRIGEIVRLMPFSRQTIHNYTKMGLIQTAGQTDAGHRLYDEAVFERLDQIISLKGTHSLKDIANLLQDSSRVLLPLRVHPKREKLYRVGEIVRRTHLSRQTLYRYRAVGLIRETQWTEGGYTLYDEAVFERLDQVQELKRKGYSLSEIRDLLTKGHRNSPSRARAGSGLYRVEDVVRQTGFSRQRIYRYRQMGLIRETHLTKRGQRLYNESVIEKLKLIVKLNNAGYPLRAIRELFLEGRQSPLGLKDANNKS